MPTSDTINLTGQQVGPNGGTGFRFEYYAVPDGPLVDRSVALYVKVWELGTPQGDIVQCWIDNASQGVEATWSMKGLGAAGLRAEALSMVM